MTIQTITVRAGRTFNHPHEQYSNLRPEVEMIATLSPGEDAEGATRTLQAKAEALVEQHKRQLLDTIEDLYQSAEIERELANLEGTLRSAQARMEDLRRRKTELLPETSTANPS